MKNGKPEKKSIRIVSREDYKVTFTPLANAVCGILAVLTAVIIWLFA